MSRLGEELAVVAATSGTDASPSPAAAAGESAAPPTATAGPPPLPSSQPPQLSCDRLSDRSAGGSGSPNTGTIDSTGFVQHIAQLEAAAAADGHDSDTCSERDTGRTDAQQRHNPDGSALNAAADKNADGRPDSRVHAEVNVATAALQGSTPCAHCCTCTTFRSSHNSPSHCEQRRLDAARQQDAAPAAAAQPDGGKWSPSGQRSLQSKGRTVAVYDAQRAKAELSKQMDRAQQLLPDKPPPPPERRPLPKGLFQGLVVPLVAPILVCLLCASGLVLHGDKVHFEPDFGSYYEPAEQGKRISSRDPVTKPALFNQTNSAFDAPGWNSHSDFVCMLSTGGGGRGVLDEAVLDAYLQLGDKVRQIRVTDERHRDGYGVEELCARDCTDVLAMIMSGGHKVPLTYPETFVAERNGTVQGIYLASTFGGVETDPQGAIAHARSLAMHLKLSNPKSTQPDTARLSHFDVVNVADTRRDDQLTVLQMWGNEFNRVLLSLRNSELFKGLSLRWWTYANFESAAGDALRFGHILLAASGAVALLVALGAMILGADMYSAKPLLALAAMLFVIVATAAAYGIVLYSTLHFEPTSFAALLPTSGVCLLVALHLALAWRRYGNVAVHPAEKLMIVMSCEGPMCLITTLTLSITYAILYATVNPLLVAWQCGLAAAIFAMFTLCLLVGYAAALYATGLRQSAGFKWFQLCAFRNKADFDFPTRLTSTYKRRQVGRLQRKLCSKTSATPLRKLGALCASVHFRFLTVLVLCVYVVFAAWGCAGATVQLGPETLISPGSGPAEFLSDHGRYFSRMDDYVELVFNDILDYNNDKTRRAILHMLDWAQKSEYAQRSVSWLADFAGFNRSTKYAVSSNTFVPVVALVPLPDPVNCSAKVWECPLVYLRNPRYARFKADVAFDQYQSQIVASRMYLQLTRKGTGQLLSLIDGLVSLAREAELPMVVRSPGVFMVQHDLQIRAHIAAAFTEMVCLVSVLALVGLAEPFSALLTLLVCLSTSAGAFGLGAMWNVPLNAPNMATVLVGEAVCAAACLIFCSSYVNSYASASTNVGRMEHSFAAAAPSVLCACAATALASLPLLAASPAPFLVHTVKIVLLQCALALAHIVFLVAPVMHTVAENMSRGCGAVRSCADDVCCTCCDADEDAASIYYIATTSRAGKPLHPDSLRHFMRTAGINGEPVVVDAYALPAPSMRPMLMPPPPPSNPGDTLDYIMPPYGHVQPRSTVSPQRQLMHGSVHGSVHAARSRASIAVPGEGMLLQADSRGSPARADRYARHSKTPSSQGGAHKRRSYVAPLDEGGALSADEAIYEEPPEHRRTKSRDREVTPAHSAQHRHRHRDAERRRTQPHVDSSRRSSSHSPAPSDSGREGRKTRGHRTKQHGDAPGAQHYRERRAISPMDGGRHAAAGGPSWRPYMYEKQVQRHSVVHVPGPAAPMQGYHVLPQQRPQPVQPMLAYGMQMGPPQVHMHPHAQPYVRSTRMRRY